MWPSNGLNAVWDSICALSFVEKAVTAAVALAILVLALGGTVHEAQTALQTSAVVSVVIAAMRGEP